MILLMCFLLAGEPELFETAVVRKRALESATSSVTLLDRDLIEATGARHAAELLWFVPGVSLTGGDARGSLKTASLRGGDPNFTHVMIDGVPVNNLAYQVGGAFDLAGLPASLIERVEIVRGPLSSVFGSTGLSGVIHFITRRSEAAGTQASLSGGDADDREVALHTGGRLGALQAQLSAGYDHESKRIAAESTEGLWVQSHVTRTFAHMDFAFDAQVQDRQTDDYPDASGGPIFGDGALRSSDHRIYGAALSLQLGSDRNHLIQLTGFRHVLNRNSPAVGFSVPASQEDITFSEYRAGWRYRAVVRDRLTLHVGLDWERERGVNRSVLDLGFPLPGDYRADRDTTAVSADMLWEMGGLWELTTRIDFPESEDTEWSPRLGYRRPLTNVVDLRASIGRAFKRPDFFATFSPPALGGNPDLEAETVIGADLALSGAGNEVHWSLTAFANRYRELVDFDFDQFLHVNRDEVEVVGIESNLAWSIFADLRIQGNLTWQDVSADEELRNRPEWTGAAALTWTPLPRWRMTADARHRGDVTDQQIPVTDRFTVDAYTRYGLTVDHDIADTWRIQLRIDNLTDHAHETLIGFPSAERSWRLTLSFRGDR